MVERSKGLEVKEILESIIITAKPVVRGDKNVNEEEYMKGIRRIEEILKIKLKNVYIQVKPIIKEVEVDNNAM